MIFTKLRYNSRGSILLMALWILGLLVVFSVHIGLKLRQRITLLSTIESRSRLRHISEAGVKKAVAALRYDLGKSGGFYTPYGKFYRHNSQERFKDIPLGNGSYSIEYSSFEGKGFKRRFGFVDEERKLNINLAHFKEIEKLISRVTALTENEAQVLALSIIEWRELGDTELEGFFSDDYYATQKDPYEPKNAQFEFLDELKLVRNVTHTVFGQLKPFITVYGNGSVNINTASPQVLYAIGFTDELIEKILFVRNGADGNPNTVDDYVFMRTYDVASEMRSFVKLSTEEVGLIDAINNLGKISTNSFYYNIASISQLGADKRQMRVETVYNSVMNRFEYWREN